MHRWHNMRNVGLTVLPEDTLTCRLEVLKTQLSVKLICHSLTGHYFNFSPIYSFFFILLWPHAALPISIDCFTLLKRVPPLSHTFCLKGKRRFITPLVTNKGKTYYTRFKQLNFFRWWLWAPINCVFPALGRSVANALSWVWASMVANLHANDSVTRGISNVSGATWVKSEAATKVSQVRL